VGLVGTLAIVARSRTDGNSKPLSRYARVTRSCPDRALAAIYDHIGRRAESVLAPYRAELIAHARGRVLEIGAGTGFNAAHYRADVEELVLTEPSPAMLARAERRARATGRRVHAVRASAERLPFDDASFDAVVSTFVLCSVDDQAQTLAEIRRVLTAGAPLLFLEHVRSDEPRLARWQDRLERPWGLVAFGCHPNRRTRDRIKSAGFVFDAFERRDLPRSPPLVRPAIMGRAIAP
jgi:SAM-dependent methyltransferase